LAKNRLDADFINQRLNGGAKPVYHGKPIFDADSDDRAMTPAFMAGLLALCLAVAGGTYFFAGSGRTLDDLMTSSTGRFVSAADSACKKMWVPNGKNSQAVACYLTSNVSRLCDPREKQYLVKVLRSYRNDLLASDAQMIAGGFKAVAVARSGESMNNMKIMSQTVAKQRNNPNYQESAAEKKAFAEHSKMIHKMEEAAGAPVVLRMPGFHEVEDKELVAKIRRLGTAGYMLKNDFGWFPDPLVAAAFNGVKAAGTACRK
jgi:hypothetical protein